MSNTVSEAVLPGKLIQLSFGDPLKPLKIELYVDMKVGIGGGDWPAARMFCEVVANNERFYSKMFENKRIIELGAGTALGGILVDKISSPAEVVITDLNQYLAHIQRNIDLNNSKVCSARALDWLNIDSFMHEDADEILDANRAVSGSKFDIILALECVYREDLYQPLVDTILRCSTKETIIFLGLTRLFAKPCFFDMLHSNGIYFTRLPEQALPLVLRNDNSTADCGLLLLYFSK
jgi:hypothetical protein